MTLRDLGDVITALTALVLAVAVLAMHALRWVRIWLRVRREERDASERRRVEKARRDQERKPHMGFHPD